MSRMRINKLDIKNAEVFQIVMENFPDMVHSVNEAGEIVFANKQAEVLLGYTRAELYNMQVNDIYTDEIKKQLESGFIDLKQNGEKRVESVLCSKNGEKIPVEIRSFSIYDDNNEFLHTFSIFRDLRKIKALKNDLIHAERLATVGELSSSIVHDINNPLTVIQTACQLMDRFVPALESGNMDVVPLFADYVGDIQKAAEVIRKLSHSLLSFSRKCYFDYTKLDIAQLIEDSIFICKYKIKCNRVKLEIECPKRQYFCKGVSNQLVQVFVNLISNACDSMENIDVKRRVITIKCEEVDFAGDKGIRCNISDQGLGVPEEIRSKIFKSFFTTKDMDKGTGLGLSISRGIIEDHRGKLILGKSDGNGTNFSISLPKID